MGKWRRFASRILAAVGAIVISPHPGQAQGPPSSAVPQDREMVSRVVLANTLVDLTLDSLRAKLDEIYPGQFLPPREKGNFVVDGPTAGGFFIQASMPGAAGMFLLHNVPGPYWKFSGFLKSIRDASIQREAMAQRCWLSVDLVRKSTSDEDAYRFVAQVVGKLAPPDAAFLVHPSKFIIIRFDDELRARLTRGEPILPGP
jgi:hypothetical protein